MSAAHSEAQRRLMMLPSVRAVELTKTLNLRRRKRLELKVQGVVAQAWLEGYLQAVEDLKDHVDALDKGENA